MVTDWESEAVGLMVRSCRTGSESLMRRKLALNEGRLTLNKARVLDEARIFVSEAEFTSRRRKTFSHVY